MEYKVNAIVTRSVNINESDKMLTLFSLEKGLLSASIKGVRKATAKLKFSAQPFCFAEYVISEKNNRKTVIGATEIDSFYNLRLDLIKFYSSACILEFLNKFEYEEMELNCTLFKKTLECVKIICYESGNPKLYLIKYLFECASICGYDLFLESCGLCQEEIQNRCFLSVENGCIHCESCKDESDVEFNFSTYELLKTISKLNYDGLTKIEISDKNVINRALKFLNYYFYAQTGEKITAIETLIGI